MSWKKERRTSALHKAQTLQGTRTHVYHTCPTRLLTAQPADSADYSSIVQYRTYCTKL